MIRFKLIRVDPGTEHLVPVVKNNVRRLVMSGHTLFTRNFEFGNNVTARARYFAGIATISLTKLSTTTSVAYHMTKTGWSTTPYTLSSIPKSMNEEVDGFSFAHGSLEPIRPGGSTRFAALTTVVTTDEGADTVIAVNDSPIVARCAPSIGVSTQAPSGLTITTALLDRLYEDKHGAMLVSACTRRLTLRTPAAFRWCFNEYVDAVWKPVTFWKEGNDIWALCMICDESQYFTGSGGATGITNPAARPDILPCTGDFNVDRYSDDAAHAAFIANRASDTGPGHIDYWPPSLLSNQHPFIFLKAKVVDLFTLENILAAVTIQKSTASTYEFVVFGVTYSVPLSDLTVGDVDATVERVQGIGKFRVRFVGVVQLVNSTPTFFGTATLVSFYVNRNVWTDVEQIPEGEITPPLAPFYSPSTADYRAVVEMQYTEGIPFTAYTLIDLRADVAGGDRHQVIPGFAFTSLAYDAAAEQYTYNSMFANVWPSYFNGVMLRCSKYKEYFYPYRVLSETPEGSSPAYARITELVQSSWMRYDRTGITTRSAKEVISYLNSGMISDYKVHARTALIRESRGELADAGTFGYDATSSGVGAHNFEPSTSAVGIGIDAYGSGSPVYDGLFHPRTGFAEIRPWIWESNYPINGVWGRPGKKYKSVVVQPYAKRADAPSSRNPVIEYNTTPTGWVFGFGVTTRTSVYTDDSGNPTITGQASISRYWVDTMEYPAPEPWYLDESEGGPPDADAVTRTRLSVVSIYYPKLTSTTDGFCLIKLRPASNFVRVIYYHGEFNASGIALIKAWADRLLGFTIQPVFNPYPAYVAKISAFQIRASGILSRITLPPESAPRPSEYEALRADALALVRESYEVLANNFASRALMDFIDSTVIIFPYR